MPLPADLEFRAHARDAADGVIGFDLHRDASATHCSLWRDNLQPLHLRTHSHLCLKLAISVGHDTESPRKCAPVPPTHGGCIDIGHVAVPADVNEVPVPVDHADDVVLREPALEYRV